MSRQSPHIKRISYGDNPYSDFLFAATVKKEAAEAKSFTIRFGVAEERYQSATFDFEHGRVLFGDEIHAMIKSAEFHFDSAVEYRLCLVVNDGVAKVYVDQSDTALLLYRLPGYVPGKVGHDLAESHFSYRDESILNLKTHSGDYFVGGYEVEKVVNLSDDNVTLTKAQYTVEAGVVTIDQGYLDTLETNAEYKFRAVTSFTDFDFYVLTDETGVEATPQVAKYYRGNDVSFELSEPSRVSKVLVDGEFFAPEAFRQNESLDLLTLKAEALEGLPSGDPPVNHVYFYIDIAIFATLIVGYVLFSQISKRTKKKQ